MEVNVLDFVRSRKFINFNLKKCCAFNHKLWFYDFLVEFLVLFFFSIIFKIFQIFVDRLYLLSWIFRSLYVCERTQYQKTIPIVIWMY
jgi:hypothetical protein